MNLLMNFSSLFDHREFVHSHISIYRDEGTSALILVALQLADTTSHKDAHYLLFGGRLTDTFTVNVINSGDDDECSVWFVPRFGCKNPQKCCSAK